MPYWITSGQDFLDWLNSEKNAIGEPRWSHEVKRRTLQKLKAATAWAAKTRLLSRDPFANIDNFPQRRLADAGAIAFPLSQYHARHTWITEMLKSHAIADVAYLARTSPEIIMQHYAGRSRSYTIPEFS